MSLLVAHQVPLPESFRLSGAAAGDDSLKRTAEHLATEIERGQSLPQAVDGTPQLPPLLRWLITVGEQQAMLAESLRQAADVYENRAIAKMDWFRRIVPPLAVIICCGTITALYALALFLPVAHMLEQMKVA
jgi:type II secretory pathway component PulF